MSVESVMVDYYAQRAREYERIYEKPERQEELLELKRVVRVAFAARDVLEVACGTGYWTEVVADTASSVTALDINESVLEVARAKPINPAKVSFQIGDAYHLPSFPRKFDAALTAFLWSHIPKSRLADFLFGLQRALKPGAIVLFLDNTYVEGESTPITRRDGEGNTFQTRRLENGNAFEVLKNYPAEQELRDAIQGYAECRELRWLKHYWWLRSESRTAGKTVSLK